MRVDQCNCCDFLCLLTERRRYCEILWRKRLLVTENERKAKRRFLALMRGFDTEDLDAVLSGGLHIRQCAPGPPMDLLEDVDLYGDTIGGSGENEEDDEFDDEQHMTNRPGCSSTVMSSRPRPPARTLTHMQKMERDRVIFQRQVLDNTRNPLTVTAQSPQHHPRRYQSPRRTPRPRSGGGPMSAEQQHQNREDTPGGGSGGGSGTAGLDWGLIPQIDRAMSIPYLCCKMWRWKELQVDAALHRLDPMPWCRFGRVTINNATVSCCNPFHYGLWIRPEPRSTRSSSGSAPAVGTGDSSVAATCNGGGTTLQQNACTSSRAPTLRRLSGLSPPRGSTSTTQFSPRKAPTGIAGASSADPELLAMGHVRQAFSRSVTTPQIGVGGGARGGPEGAAGGPYRGGPLMPPPPRRLYDDDEELEELPPLHAPPPVPGILGVVHDEDDEGERGLKALVARAEQQLLGGARRPSKDGHPIQAMMNHVEPAAAAPTSTTLALALEPSIHVAAMTWGRLIRWEGEERVGDVVNLYGQFAAIGKIAGTVFDGQDVRSPWDTERGASFAIIRLQQQQQQQTRRRSSGGGGDHAHHAHHGHGPGQQQPLDEFWLYNSSDRPLFFLTSSKSLTNQAKSESPNIRRLSPGYCIIVHRGPPPGTQLAAATMSAAAAVALDWAGGFGGGGGGTSSPTATLARPKHHHHTAPPQITFLTISIGLGWGPHYDARQVNELPCRYEVIFC